MPTSQLPRTDGPLMQQLLDAAPFAAAVVDVAGWRLRHANARFAHRYLGGVRPGGEPLAQIAALNWLPAVLEEAQDNAAETPLRIVAPDSAGDVHAGDWQIVPIVDASMPAGGFALYAPMAPEATTSGTGDFSARDIRRAYELSNDLLCVAGTDDRFRAVNAAFTRVLGWSRDEMLAHPGAFFAHPDDRERTAQEVAQLADGVPTTRFENRYRHKDGSYRWISWVATPVIEEGAIFAAGRDITERKRAEALQRAEGLLADYRLRLADALRPLANPVDIQDTAARVLGTQLRASRTLYAEVLLDSEAVFVERDHTDGVVSIAGRHRLEAGGLFFSACHAGLRFAVDDTRADPRLSDAERAAAGSFDIRAVAGVPLLKQGHPVALLCVHHRQPHAWTDAELRLIEETAERTWAAVERARSDAALRDSEARLRVLVETAACAVWETDSQGAVTVDSTSWRSFTGQTFEQWVGWGWLDAVHPEDRAHAERAWRDAVAGERMFDAEYRLRSTQHGWRWTNVRGAPVRDADGRIRKWIGMNLDITERKQAEQALRDADARKDEFLAMLAHELRNPLAVIHNVVRLFQAAPNAASNPDHVRILHRQARHLRDLVDDLLDISRITRGLVELERTQVDLADILQRSIESTQPLIDERGHRLRTTLPARPLIVDGDAVRLEQIVVNLLTNSAKYTDHGGNIDVALIDTGAAAEIRVRDDGIGMSAEMVARVFELFGQAERGLARSQGGLGIGLTIVERMVKLHGGTITASSDGPGRGAEFVVRLPLATELTPIVSEPGAAVAAVSSPRRILVVDDNGEIARTMATLLAHRGHVVITADDGPQALRTADAHLPDVILLDIGLPGLDGFEVARRLRNDPRHASRLIVAVTGYGQARDHELSRDAGFDAHFVKPVDLDALLGFMDAQGGAATAR